MSENSNSGEAPVYEKQMQTAQHFLDIPMKITIQLAQRNMKVRDILRLQPNSIVELPKSAGENVDILVNQRLIAFGEVLELEGCAGIRLTDLNTLT
jgi:flagellar motor switch protein FliN/FliY